MPETLPILHGPWFVNARLDGGTYIDTFAADDGYDRAKAWLDDLRCVYGFHPGRGDRAEITDANGRLKYWLRA